MYRQAQRSSIVSGTANPVFVADPLEYVFIYMLIALMLPCAVINSVIFVHWD